MATQDRESHWQDVYAKKTDTEVSWYEESPELSLSLLQEAGLSQGMSIIDIGGGASRLVDALVKTNQAHITVLDLSSAALKAARARLRDDAMVKWVVADVTAWSPDREYDFWHDRAAFHFLTSPVDQQAYVRVLKRSLKNDGKFVIGTFAVDGPEKCSGLAVVRYDVEGLQSVLGERFKLIGSRPYQHTTPWGATQNFLFNTFVKI